VLAYSATIAQLLNDIDHGYGLQEGSVLADRRVVGFRGRVNSTLGVVLAARRLRGLLWQA
jgi:ribosomal protein L34